MSTQINQRIFQSMNLREFDKTRALFSITTYDQCGLINVCSNTLVIPVKYDRIINYYYHSDWRNNLPYKGLISVMKDGKFGIVTILWKCGFGVYLR